MSADLTERLSGSCSMHGERLRYESSEMGPMEPGCTCERVRGPASMTHDLTERVARAIIVVDHGEADADYWLNVHQPGATRRRALAYTAAALAAVADAPGLEEALRATLVAHRRASVVSHGGGWQITCGCTWSSGVVSLGKDEGAYRSHVADVQADVVRAWAGGAL